MRKNVLVLGLVFAAAMSARAQQGLTPAGPNTPGQAFQDRKSTRLNSSH